MWYDLAHLCIKNICKMLHNPRSAFDILKEVRPVVQTPGMRLSKQMRTDMELLCLRFLREPINNPDMKADTVAMAFPELANQQAKEGIMYFNILCKPTRQHYHCSIDAQSDTISLLKTSVWSEATYAHAMQNDGVVGRSTERAPVTRSKSC